MPRATPVRKRSPLLEVVAAFILALVVTGIILAVRQNSTQVPRQPAQLMTLAPEIVANMTALPDATRLAPEDAQVWEDFRAVVNACEEYTQTRREQMNLHIDWLIDPSDMPNDVIIAVGTNPAGRLIYGMAGYTATEWRQGGRLPESCLLDIGKQLNVMLEAAGEPPFALFETES